MRTVYPVNLKRETINQIKKNIYITLTKTCVLINAWNFVEERCMIETCNRMEWTKEKRSEGGGKNEVRTDSYGTFLFLFYFLKRQFIFLPHSLIMSLQIFPFEGVTLHFKILMFFSFFNDVVVTNKFAMKNPFGNWYILSDDWRI